MIFAYALRFVSMFFLPGLAKYYNIQRNCVGICRISHFPCTLVLSKVASFLENIDILVKFCNQGMSSPVKTEKGKRKGSCMFGLVLFHI